LRCNRWFIYSFIFIFWNNLNLNFVSEYCDHDFPNPVGKCKLGSEAGQSCLRDRHCASKRCHFLKCANRLKMKDGPCKIDSDCPDDQYCMKLPNTDDLRMCTNRNILGACLKDSECLSGRCHLFTCVKL
jgi:hypothetical protein